MGETVKKDKRKEEQLKEAGFHVLRFDDEEILKSISRVIEVIDLKIEEIERSAPSPPKKRRQAVKKEF
jgi:very-short-patch-repair endonuclease